MIVILFNLACFIIFVKKTKPNLLVLKETKENMLKTILPTNLTEQEKIAENYS